jgi:hypothetical protein
MERVDRDDAPRWQAYQAYLHQAQPLIAELEALARRFRATRWLPASGDTRLPIHQWTDGAAKQRYEACEAQLWALREQYDPAAMEGRAQAREGSAHT